MIKNNRIVNRFVLTLIILCLSLVSVDSFAQLWMQRVYGGQSYDFGREVIQTADDGYLIAGSTGSFGLESAEVMLIKTTDLGHVEWRKYYGGPFADQAESMELGLDGNYVVGGFTERIGKSYDAYALKIEPDGDTIWTKHYGGELWDFAKQLVTLSDGGVALFGQTYSYGAGNGDFYLLRLNADGDTLWTKTYGGPELESGESIALMPDGGFALAGFTESYGAGGRDGYLVRTDADGDTLWTKTYGGVEDDHIYAVCTTLSGGLALAGGTNSQGAGKSDFMILKVDASGVYEWSFIDGGPLDDYWYDLIEDGVGNFIAVGYTEDGPGGLDDYKIIRVGPDSIWNGVATSYGGGGTERAYDIKQTSDNGYVIIGNSDGFLFRFDDVYLVKTDYDGVTIPFVDVSVDEIITEDQTFKVAIGPNPFFEIPTLQIQNFTELQSSLDSPIEIKVYSAVGSLVYTSEANRGITRLTGLEVSKGIYAYQLVSGGSVLATGKMVSLR